MHRDILEKLSVITKEEQRILDGQENIDTHIYTEKKELVIDCEKLLQKGKLIQVRPHTRFVHFPPSSDDQRKKKMARVQKLLYGKFCTLAPCYIKTLSYNVFCGRWCHPFTPNCSQNVYIFNCVWKAFLTLCFLNSGGVNPQNKIPPHLTLEK